MRRPGASIAAASAMALAAAACSKSKAAENEAGSPVVVSAPSTTAPGAPRPGMVWIPAGVLHAGSAPDDVPRVADAELPGADVPMAGFYMDVLPWPNEAGAIPTTNVSRDEAARLCGEKGKRLCSELEWERACKGPDNLRYEYGASYDPRVCGAGAPADTAARRPSGDKLACKSAFGVRDMHGGAWEWTDSHWNRGEHGHDLGVLRGGNDTAGELETRCAAARPAASGDREATTTFRCCAGPRNEAEVQLEVKTGSPFERTMPATRPSPVLDALGGVACGPPTHPSPCFVARAWTWRPVPNVELLVSGGCVGHDPTARCAVGIAQVFGDRVSTLAQIDCGREIPEVVLVAGPDHRIRVRGMAIRGPFFREVSFNYGRVDVREVR